MSRASCRRMTGRKASRASRNRRGSHRKKRSRESRGGRRDEEGGGRTQWFSLLLPHPSFLSVTFGPMATTVAPPGLVTLDDLEAAARTLAGVAVRTPLLPVDALAERFGVPVWIKPEMLQRGGA